MMKRRIPESGPCIVCGKETRSGGVWMRDNPLGPGSKIAYFYCLCKGTGPAAFAFIEFEIERELARGGQWLPMVEHGDG